MLGLFKRYQVENVPLWCVAESLMGVNQWQVCKLRVSLIYAGYQNGKEQLEHTLTDADGRFSFKPLIVKSRKPRKYIWSEYASYASDLC